MSNQPDHRRLTIWERLPTRQPRTRQRWSTPAQPTASLVQPGYTDLGPRPSRPLRAPAYPLSSRPFLDQQTPAHRTSSQQTSSQQSFQQISPQQIPTQQASPQHTPSQPRVRLRNRVHRISRLFRPSRRGSVPAQASPPTSSPPPSIIISPPTPSPGADPVALEHPRRTPLPPSPPPAPHHTPLLSKRTVSQPQPPLPLPLFLPSHNHTSHPPANRRPLSVPPPLHPGAPDDSRKEAEQYLHSRPSLQLSRFALCHACSRVRRCTAGLGGGRVLCVECLRQLFTERQE